MEKHNISGDDMEALVGASWRHNSLLLSPEWQLNRGGAIILWSSTSPSLAWTGVLKFGRVGLNCEI